MFYCIIYGIDNITLLLLLVMATWQFSRYYRASACNHAERDIVMANPSVHLSVRLSECKWLHCALAKLWRSAL